VSFGIAAGQRVAAWDQDTELCGKTMGKTMGKPPNEE